MSTTKAKGIYKNQAWFYDGKPYATEDDALDAEFYARCNNIIGSGSQKGIMDRGHLTAMIKQNLQLIHEVYFCRSST